MKNKYYDHVQQTWTYDREYNVVSKKKKLLGGAIVVQPPGTIVNPLAGDFDVSILRADTFASANTPATLWSIGRPSTNPVPIRDWRDAAFFDNSTLTLGAVAANGTNPAFYIVNFVDDGTGVVELNNSEIGNFAALQIDGDAVLQTNQDSTPNGPTVGSSNDQITAVITPSPAGIAAGVPATWMKEYIVGVDVYNTTTDVLLDIATASQSRVEVKSLQKDALSINPIEFIPTTEPYPLQETKFTVTTGGGLATVKQPINDPQGVDFIFHANATSSGNILNNSKIAQINHAWISPTAGTLEADGWERTHIQSIGTTGWLVNNDLTQIRPLNNIGDKEKFGYAVELVQGRLNPPIIDQFGVSEINGIDGQGLPTRLGEFTDLGKPSTDILLTPAGAPIVADIQAGPQVTTISSLTPVTYVTWRYNLVTVTSWTHPDQPNFPFNQYTNATVELNVALSTLNTGVRNATRGPPAIINTPMTTLPDGLPAIQGPVDSTKRAGAIPGAPIPPTDPLPSIDRSTVHYTTGIGFNESRLRLYSANDQSSDNTLLVPMVKSGGVANITIGQRSSNFANAPQILQWRIEMPGATALSGNVTLLQNTQNDLVIDIGALDTNNIIPENTLVFVELTPGSITRGNLTDNRSLEMASIQSTLPVGYVHKRIQPTYQAWTIVDDTDTTDTQAISKHSINLSKPVTGDFGRSASISYVNDLTISFDGTNFVTYTNERGLQPMLLALERNGWNFDTDEIVFWTTTATQDNVYDIKFIATGF